MQNLSHLLTPAAAAAAAAAEAPSAHHHHHHHQPPPSAAAFFATGALNNVTAAPFLDLIPQYLEAPPLSPPPPHAHFHARLVLPVLRLVSAACALESPPSPSAASSSSASSSAASPATTALLASFLLRSDERVASMVTMLRGPMRYTPPAAGGSTAHAALPPTVAELQIGSLLLHQVLQLTD